VLSVVIWHIMLSNTYAELSSLSQGVVMLRVFLMLCITIRPTTLSVVLLSVAYWPIMLSVILLRVIYAECCNKSHCAG
jgi:hypothetical protein